jgi:hypothetical protein
VIKRIVVLVVLALGLLLSAAAVAAVLDRPATTVHDEMVVTAPRTLVWELLTDFEGYADWNPYIVRARGEARKGAEVELWLELHEGDLEKFECDVLDVKERRKLRWLCRTYGVPGVLDREQTFHVLPLGPGRVRLVYDGRLEGLFQPFTDLDHLKLGYKRMTHALKERAETVSAG